MYADSRVHGIVFSAVLVGSVWGAGTVTARLTRGHAVAEAATVAITTWSVLGGRSLRREAQAVSRLLEDADLDGARRRVTHLVGRDPTTLPADEIARATVESVAENCSDAVVAPLLAGALFGLPGLVAYRAANTLDAMVGHRSDRYERFGWASARLDDVLNLVPSRLSGLLAAALAPAVSGRPADAARAWRRDASAHPSPNAGVVEAAFAGALGVRLGGRNVYGDRVEDRARLGDGRAPGVRDISRAVLLADLVEWATLAIAVSGALAPRRLRRQGR